MSTIAIINKVFNRDGAKAAAQRALDLGEEWAAVKIFQGDWDPNYRKPALALPVHTQVDRNGDQRLFKVTFGDKVTGYVVKTIGESGQIASERALGKVTLAEARVLIGKGK